MFFDLPAYRMHYEFFGDPKGQPLLWLSGWTGTSADWKYIFTSVPDGFRIVGVDLRGNGASTGFDGDHSFEQSARNVLALLDHLEIPHAKAIGLSGGGVVLLHMATQQPQRISVMVVISSPPSFPPQARAIQKQFSFAALPEAEQTRMRSRCKGGQQQIDWLAKQTHLMAEQEDDVNFTSTDLAKITARTLIVFGDKDPLYPVSLAHELSEGIHDSSLWVVPGGGHGPVFGSNAPLFAERAIEFLRSS